MKERPILFNGDMVRAILDGRKTQTRRIVKGMSLDWLDSAKFTPEYVALPENDMCPYGKVGDRLWVRETCQATQDGMTFGVNYLADNHTRWLCRSRDTDWLTMYDYRGASGATIPSIHMPRWASRIQLEIVSVRVERLNGISESDAKAEGMFFTDYGRNCFHNGSLSDVGDCQGGDATHPLRNGWSWKETASSDECLGSTKWAFANLWQSINGAESWQANPWVWVVEFKRLAEAGGDN
jgi:hypothetical protein